VSSRIFILPKGGMRLATTRLMPIHARSGRTIQDVIDYMENPEKTRNGELITSYECDSRIADAQFLLSKRQYFNRTGRSQGRNDVTAYHTRQAFKPGEISPEEANRLGYELAMRFTKGNHAFIVCTHIDKEHTHNHIIFNSTALDCKRKFRNFLGSAFAVRRISDHLCVENGLSIVEDPKPRSKSKYQHYGQWLGDDKPPSFQEKLRQAIDGVLEKKPADCGAFLTGMEALGYEVKRGKHLAFKEPGQKNFTRCRESTLGADYTEEAVHERITGQRAAPVRRNGIPKAEPQMPSLLIDIQAKIQAGKGPGYERWAKVFNLKQAAQTLIYLQEHDMTDYRALSEKTAAATARFNELSGRMKELETKLISNASLQKHIVNYSKTRDVYVQYRKAGYSKKFREIHEADILLHQAAKKAFDELGVQKLPTVASLRADYAVQLEEKKKAYREYRQTRLEMRELLVVKDNVDRLLNIPDCPKEREPHMERD